MIDAAANARLGLRGWGKRTPAAGRIFTDCGGDTVHDARRLRQSGWPFAVPACPARGDADMDRTDAEAGRSNRGGRSSFAGLVLAAGNTGRRGADLRSQDVRAIATSRRRPRRPSPVTAAACSSRRIEAMAIIRAFRTNADCTRMAARSWIWRSGWCRTASGSCLATVSVQRLRCTWPRMRRRGRTSTAS